MSDKTDQTEYDFRNEKHQYYAALVANIIFIGHGNMNGWVAIGLHTLLSENSPLKTGPLTNEQVSWIGSINSIGAILGTFTFGYITMRLGCKRAMLFITLPCTLIWILIYLGWCGLGVQMCIILYISEISNDNIRGRLGTFSQLTRNFGILIAYIVGTILPYALVPCVFVFVPIIFGVWFFFLPNTTQFHLQKGQLKKAENSLKYYKGYKGKSVNEVIAFSNEFERLKLVASKQQDSPKITAKDLFNHEALKGLLNGIILASLVHSAVTLVIITYSLVIFDKVGAKRIDPFISTITIGIMQFVGVLCTTTFSDSLGRKALLTISLLGTSFGLMVFSLYSYLKQNGHELTAFEFVPVVSLSFVIFIASAGIGPLFFVCTVENLPSKIRTIGLTICNLFFNMVSFTCLKLFPTLMVIIGLHGCMLIFAIACILGSLYVYFGMKETKCISLDAVYAGDETTTKNSSRNM